MGTRRSGHCVGTVAGGDGIASAGATSGESIKRKIGEISDSEECFIFPNRNKKKNTTTILLR